MYMFIYIYLIGRFVHFIRKKGIGKTISVVYIPIKQYHSYYLPGIPVL